MAIDMIIAGGQSGVDRAALDWAIRRGVAHGGWCPAGRRAEDGPLAACYRLTETRATQYAVRTRWNVRDSDGTVVITPSRDGGSPGTARTIDAAVRLGRPLMILDAGNPRAAGRRLRRFVEAHAIRRLNVAGPRESEAPGIGSAVAIILDAAFARSVAAAPCGHR